MNNEKILAVLGTPRSGTSLLMRMLDAMGVPVAGEREMTIASEPGDRARVIADAARNLNPDGFFEVPGLVGRGLFSRRIMEGLDLGGKAVKLVGSAMLPIDGVTPRGTDYSLVDRVILCLRDPREVAASQTGLVSGVMRAGDDEWTAKVPHALSPATYIRDLGRLCMAMAEGWPVPVLVVAHERWRNVDDRAKQVEALASFVGAESGEKAGQLWDDGLYRSRPNNWPEHLAADGAIADAIYAALLDGDPATVAPLAEAWLSEQQAERVAWYDGDAPGQFGTHQMINPASWRQLASNARGCRDKLTVNAAKRREAGVLSVSCPHFALSRKTLPMSLPADLVGVSVPVVACGLDGDTKPQQACQRCWTHGIARATEAASKPVMLQVRMSKEAAQ